MRLREVKLFAQGHTVSKWGAAMETEPISLPALDLGPLCRGTVFGLSPTPASPSLPVSL